MKNIKLKMSATSIATTAIVLACVFVLNVIIGVITEKFPLKIDFTKDKAYEFSAQTKVVMKNLEDDITAYLIIDNNEKDEYVDYIKAYIEKYKVYSEHFNVQYINPHKDTAFMSKYVISEQGAKNGTVVLEKGDVSKVLSFEEFYVVDDFSPVLRIDMERKVTNAIMELTGQNTTANIYFISGHSELEMSNLEALLAEEGNSCKEINLLIDEIPNDANILMCVAPQADFADEEIAKLSAFLDNGGRFIFAAHPGMERMEKFDRYIQEWGMSLNYDSIVEVDSKYVTVVNGTPTIAAKLLEHPINEKIKESDATLAMPFTMSISIRKSTNGATITNLLSTSDRAYGKTNLNSTNSAKEGGDISGPLSMAAIAERSDNGVKSGIMIIGSSLALEYPMLLSEGVFLNSDFILNSINYMSGVTTTSDIRAKQISSEIMSINEAESKMISTILIWWIPASILLLGLIIWLRRRFK